MWEEHDQSGDPASSSEQDAAAGQDPTPLAEMEAAETPACPQPVAENASNAETTNNSGENAEEANAAAAEPAAGISNRKLQANRANAKKSSGPRTARGKAAIRFNALRHGLLAKRVMFAPDGKLLDSGLEQLLDALREKYGSVDVRVELLMEATVVDYWRNAKGLEYEMKYLGARGCEFHPQGGMPSLQRYLTANRNALLQDLELLEEQQASPAAVKQTETAQRTDVDDSSVASPAEDADEPQAA